MNLANSNPEHWRGLLHILPHSRALCILEAAGARWPLTPDDCRRSNTSASKHDRRRRQLWRRHQRYGFVLCHWCRTPLTKALMTQDHLRARCFGGPDELDNLVPACVGCNTRRSQEQARLLDELRLDWTLAELRLVA